MRRFIKIVENAQEGVSSDYLYHGTSKNKLGSIRIHGLIPNDDPKRSRFGASYRFHSAGRTFFTTSESKAEWYAKDLAPKSPVVLRVAKSAVPDLAEDMRDTDSWFTTSRIPVDALEVLTSRGWRRLINTVENAQKRVFYHVTPSVNAASIQANGLMPQTGERSQLMGDHGIFLFGSPEDAEDAVMNWLGDEFEENEPLTLLKVSLPATARVTRDAFEIVCHEPIPADHIEVVGEI